MIKDFGDFKPEIHPETFIAETGVIIGKAKLGIGSSVWYNVVIRADINDISVGCYTNIQDNAVLHVGVEDSVEAGDYTTIGHSAIIHGCKIGNNCLIGMNAVILNGAHIDDNCIVGAGSVVTKGTKIPPNSLVLGTPGKVVRELKPEDLMDINEHARRYVELWRKHYI